MRASTPLAVEITSSSKVSFFDFMSKVQRRICDGARSPLEIGSSMVILPPCSTALRKCSVLRAGPLNQRTSLRVAVARQDADQGRQAAVPLPHRLAGLEPRVAGGARDDRKKNVVLRDRDVVDDADIRRLEPHLFDDVAVLADRVDGDVVGEIALGLVAVGDHLAGHRIDLRMRRHAGGRVLAVEVPPASVSSVMRIDVPGQRVFLERHQLAAVPVDMRVGGGAVDVRDARIVGVSGCGTRHRGACAPCARPSAAPSSHSGREIDRAVREAERLTWPSPLKPVGHSFCGGRYAKSHCMR